MVQTNYAQASASGVPGLHVDSKVGYVQSAAAEEVMPFGVLAVEHATDPEIVRLPGAGVIVVTDDAGTWTAGNVVTTINGVVVTVAFDTNKATSMAAVATALQALNFVTTAAYSDPTITITAQPNIALSVSVDVSGITGDMTISSTVGSLSDTVRGLSLKRSSEYGSVRATDDDKVVLTVSGDAITTSDTVDGVINGVAIDQVTYATSEAATLQLVVNSILEVPGVLSATTTGRTITVLNNPTLPMKNASLTITDDTTASVAPTAAAVYSRQASGVADNEVAYLAGETVGTERQAKVWCVVEEAVVKSDTVYARINTGTGTQRGAFRNDADSGTAVAITGLRFTAASETSANGSTLIAPIEINLP